MKKLRKARIFSISRRKLIASRIRLRVCYNIRYRNLLLTSLRHRERDMKIKNLLWLFALALSISTPPAIFAAQTKRAMTIDDVMSMRAVSDPRISPDGRFVAFVVTQADMKTNFRNSDVWIVATGGSESRPLTLSPRRDDSPQWSNDGKKACFHLRPRWPRASLRHAN